MSKVIKLSEETNKIAKTYLEKINDCDAGLLALSMQRRGFHKQLWDTIKAEHPEVADLMNKSTYESETGEVLVSGKWEEDDQMKFIKTYIDASIESKLNNGSK